MQHTLIIIHGIASIVALFTVVVLNSKSSSYYQRILSLTATCSFVGILSYFFELCSSTKEEAFLAARFGYLGKSYAVVLFLIFASEYCGFPMKKWLKHTLLFYSTVLFGVVATSQFHNIFYTSVEYVQNDKIRYLALGKGWGYYVFMATMIAMMFSFLVIAVKTIRSNESQDKTRFILLCMTSVPPAIALVLNIVLPQLKGFDPTPFGIFLSSVLVSYNILKHGLLDTKQIAEERVITNTKNGLIVVRNNKKFVFANDSAMDMFPELRDEEQRDGILAELFNNVSHHNIENRELKKGDRIYQMNYSTLSNASDKDNTAGRNDGYMLWVFDKTAEYNRTLELINLRDEAERANRAKSMFLANTSHEIRTPMNSIMGFTSLALEEENESTVKEYLGYIKNSSASLLRIINDILDLSRLESGKFEIIEYDYGVVNFFNQIEEQMAPLAEEKGLEFVMEIDEAIPKSLHGDHVRIREILINLISNGIKYSRSGKVELNVAVKEDTSENVLLEMHVKDTGIGIKEEVLPNVFSAFERVDGDKNYSIEGTGLGLAIVKLLVSLMGGKVSVSSVYGEGSDFCVILTQQKGDPNSILEQELKTDFEDNDEEITEEDSRKFVLNNTRILIVDDNKVNLAVEKKILEKYNITVDTANSGKLSIEMAKRRDYDLIFMDHMMPEMDGVETMKRMREIEKLKVVPIILVTANAIVGVKEKMLAEGFDGYVSKPISKIALNHELKKHVSNEKIEYVDENSIYGELTQYGIAIKDGIKYCGDEETYGTVLKIAVEGALDKIKDLNNFYTQNDYENYAILIHSIKSGLKNIGANSVSEMARELEMASKDLDNGFVDEHHEPFITAYKNTMQGIIDTMEFKVSLEDDLDTVSKAVDDVDDKEFISEEKLSEMLEKVAYHLSELDDDAASKSIDDILAFGVEKTKKEKLLTMKKYIDNMDIENSKKMLDELRES